MSNYLDELSALTEELQSLNERVREQYARRGLPAHVPIVTDGSDSELTQLAADWEAHRERERAFIENYLRPGIDPHAM